MSDRKNENIGCGFLLGVSPALIVMVAGVACLADKPNSTETQTESKFVVTAKADRKIAYTPIENATDLHVMEFRQFDMDLLLYNYINVGDTIDGNVARLSQPVTASSRLVQGKNTDFDPLVIRHVNGKDMNVIKSQMVRNAEIARRDSIVREMQQKQK